MKQVHDAAPMVLSQLLRIDVAAEQRKLGRYTLQGPWQLPSELVRMRFSSGAREVSLQFKRRGFELSDDGPLLDAAILEALYLLSDPNADDERRHLGLIELERRDCKALISLVTLNNVRFEMPTDTQHGFNLRVSSPEIDERAHRFARFALRFAALTARKVSINGKALADDLDHLLVSRRLPPPLVGAMGTPSVERDGQLWLLQHGVLSTHQSFATAPAFHCVLELPGHESAATIRAMAERMLPQLSEKYQSLLLSMAAREDLPEIVRQAVSTALLEIARKTPAVRKQVGALPLFRRVDIDGKTIRRFSVSLDVLLDDAARLGGRLCAVDAEAYPPRASDALVSVLVLGRAERALLVEAFALQFVPPTTPSRERKLAIPWRTGLTRVKTWFSTRLARRTPVAPETLTQDEIRFLEGLSRILGTTGAELSLQEGNGTVRLRADQPRPHLIETAHLPRENELVAASIARINQDGDHWRYPIALALAEGKLRRDGRAIRARADWHQSTGAPLQTIATKER